jgi:hypothetical protein
LNASSQVNNNQVVFGNAVVGLYLQGYFKEFDSLVILFRVQGSNAFVVNSGALFHFLADSLNGAIGKDNECANRREAKSHLELQ